MPQPRTHRCTFRLRYDECNAFGHVRPASLLRLMQEAAFGASAAAGYDLARYEAMHRLWLIRETAATFGPCPPAYGDSIAATTFVQDFRRVRSRRAYLLRDAASGAPVIDAITDWVLFDVDRERPTTVPEDMIAAFFPEGAPDPESVPPREPFPELPPVPPGAVALARRPDWRDLDGALHVNNTVYFDYFEDSVHQALAMGGWTLGRLMEHGVSLWPHGARIEYIQSVQSGDTCHVALWPLGGAELAHTITRQADGAILVRARIAWGWVDAHPRQPVDPPAALGDFASLFAPAAG